MVRDALRYAARLFVSEAGSVEHRRALPVSVLCTALLVIGVVIGSTQAAWADCAAKQDCGCIDCTEAGYGCGCFYDGACSPLWRQYYYINDWYGGCSTPFWRCTEYPNCGCSC